MTRVFADTFYFLALMNPRDLAHEHASEFSSAHDTPLITTWWVLTELADGLARTPYRRAFVRILRDYQSDPESVIVPPSQALLEEGIDLYDSRPDKRWSLTDCISFVVMRQERITDALTGDHHFEQAGFRALLLNR